LAELFHEVVAQWLVRIVREAVVGNTYDEGQLVADAGLAGTARNERYQT
jgi:hypothetical protein